MSDATDADRAEREDVVANEPVTSSNACTLASLDWVY